MQDTEDIKPKTDKKLSLSKQLHLGEPVVIQEEQETIQQTSELNVKAPVQKAADERQIPKADKRAAKKSITTETPTNIEIEVHFVYIKLVYNTYSKLYQKMYKYQIPFLF